ARAISSSSSDRRWRCRCSRRSSRPAAPVPWRPSTFSGMNDGAAPLLVAEDVEKDYRSGPEVVHVLRGTSMHVNPGEVVGLVGASGVGKSTLLHLLGALDRPTRGRVLFQGADLFARSEAELVRYRRHDVGFVFQFYNLLGEMSALENAMLPALL